MPHQRRSSFNKLSAFWLRLTRPAGPAKVLSLRLMRSHYILHLSGDLKLKSWLVACFFQGSGPSLITLTNKPNPMPCQEKTNLQSDDIPFVCTSRSYSSTTDRCTPKSPLPR
ncbi:unnamed protein product [Heterosigma akashiwo]